MQKLKAIGGRHPPNKKDKKDKGTSLPSDVGSREGSVDRLLVERLDVPPSGVPNKDSVRLKEKRRSLSGLDSLKLTNSLRGSPPKKEDSKSRLSKTSPDGFDLPTLSNSGMDIPLRGTNNNKTSDALEMPNQRLSTSMGTLGSFLMVPSSGSSLIKKNSSSPSPSISKKKNYTKSSSTSPSSEPVAVVVAVGGDTSSSSSSSVPLPAVLERRGSLKELSEAHEEAAAAQAPARGKFVISEAFERTVRGEKLVVKDGDDPFPKKKRRNSSGASPRKFKDRIKAGTDKFTKRSRKRTPESHSMPSSRSSTPSSSEDEDDKEGYESTTECVERMFVYSKYRFDSWMNLPEVPVEPLKFGGRYFEVRGPIVSAPGEVSNFADMAAVRSINLYPKLPGSKERLADPICDYCRCQVYSNRVMFAVADGCGWGKGPAEAANHAVNGFISGLQQKLVFSTVQEAGQILLQGLYKGHSRIVKGYSPDEMGTVGTTTICGGLLLELKRSSSTTSSTTSTSTTTSSSSTSSSSSSSALFQNSCSSQSPSLSSPSQSQSQSHSRSPSASSSVSSSGGVEGDHEISATSRAAAVSAQPKVPPLASLSENSLSSSPRREKRWGFLCASVGDCKAFLYSYRHKKLVDITYANRLNALDPTDPGGRLGPWKGATGETEPDLRNMAHRGGR